MANISGEPNCEPLIITRGVVYDNEAEQLTADARFAISSALREQDLRSFDPNEMRNNIKKVLSNFIYKRTMRRPIIIVVINTSPFC
jgi:ribonuclease J